MIKTLQKHGNSQALVLDKTIMEMLNIDADTPLQVSVSNGSLIVTPVNRGIAPEEVTDSLNRLRPRYKQMLENLAK